MNVMYVRFILTVFGLNDTIPLANDSLYRMGRSVMKS